MVVEKGQDPLDLWPRLWLGGDNTLVVRSDIHVMQGTNHPPLPFHLQLLVSQSGLVEGVGESVAAPSPLQAEQDGPRAGLEHACGLPLHVRQVQSQEALLLGADGDDGLGLFLAWRERGLGGSVAPVVGGPPQARVAYVLL